MDTFQMELVRRLPLAQATLGLLDFAVDDSFLNRLFEEFRGRCYEDTLRFSTLVGVVRDALLVHDGSGRKSIVQGRHDGEVTVNQSSVYRKLGNLPEPLSQALLREGTMRLEQVAPTGGRSLPACIGSLKPVAIDGKELKKVAKRLKAARSYTSGSLLGGMLLVAFSLHNDLALAMSCTPDGEANEVPLVPALVRQVREKVAGGILWIADRQFTDLNTFNLLGQGEDHFLIRCSRSISFEPDGQTAALEQQDAAGRRVVQQWGWLGSARDKRRRYVRRITLYRPGQEDVILVTDLLEEQNHPGLDLLELYLQRWGIEQCFQQVTEVFGLEKLIGGTPRAVIFQSALCLLLYNVAQIIRSYAAEAGNKPIAQVSTENVFYETTRELICWSKLGEAPAMPPRVPRGAGEMKRWLRNLLAGCWQEQWMKQSDKKPRAEKRKKTLPGGHGSLWKLMKKANHPHTRVA